MNRRLTAAINWDLRLQFRYGFYYAGAFVAVINIIMLTQLFSPTVIAQLLPPFMMVSMMVTGFYFIAGLVLFEKGENVLEALVVTPLRVREYLLSKAATLVFLALLEVIAIVVISYGFAINWILFLLGCVFMGAIGTFVGFLAVSRYDTINEYLFPSILWVIVLLLPILHYAGLVNNGALEVLFYLLPSQPALRLMRAGFVSAPAWELAYGVLASLAWLGVSYWAAYRAYHQFIVRRQGVTLS